MCRNVKEGKSLPTVGDFYLVEAFQQAAALKAQPGGLIVIALKEAGHISGENAIVPVQQEVFLIFIKAFS